MYPSKLFWEDYLNSLKCIIRLKERDSLGIAMTYIIEKDNKICSIHRIYLDNQHLRHNKEHLLTIFHHSSETKISNKILTIKALLTLNLIINHFNHNFQIKKVNKISVKRPNFIDKTRTDVCHNSC